MNWLKLLSLPVLTVGLATVLPDSAPAQITSGGDGTLVNQNDSAINITGGTITGGTQAGSNLFHSFGQFNVDAGQTANFVDPGVQNILGRVTGGNTSLINGALQVTGGNANLYLMNPAGIIFGSGASLDVSGSFTATTANGIGFGDKWFNAIASNDYTNLIGNPTSFAFTMAQPGAIVNVGNLVVGQGQSITLLGGTVIHTGTLTASGGKITVAAVPGEKIVNISQDGSLLSLAMPEETGATAQALPFTPLSLPQLLTGGNLSNAIGVTVENGVVRLVGSGIQIEDGNVVATGMTAQTATLSASRNLTLVESQVHTTGDLNLLAQDSVQIRDSEAKPVIVESGGNLIIQGNQAVDIFALNQADSRFVSGGDMILRSQETISSDAHYFTGGHLKFEQLDGNPGNVLSFYDPIILAAGDVTLGNYTGASLHILAGGSVTLGDVEITQPGDVATTINPNNTAPFNATQTFADLATITRADGSSLQYNGTPILDSNNTLQWINPTALVIDGSARPTLDIRAGIDWSQLGGVPSVLGVTTDIVSPTPLPNTTSSQPVFATPASANITTGKITVNPAASASDIGGMVLLTNQYFPNAALAGGEIQVNVNPTSTNTSIATPGFQGNQVVAVDSRASVTIGPVDVNGQPVRITGSSSQPIPTIDADGNSVDVLAVGDITIGDISTTGYSQAPGGNSSVTLVSRAGDILVSTIDTGANGINVQAAGLFQAIDQISLSTLGSVTNFTSLRTNLQLRNFIESKLSGISLTDSQLGSTVVLEGDNLRALPVSLMARPISGRPQGAVNAPVRIQYGEGTRILTDQFDIYPSINFSEENRTTGLVVIQGDAGFNGGPQTTALVDTADPLVQKQGSFGAETYSSVAPITDSNQVLSVANSLTFNGSYTALPFNSTSFPLNTSGTVGAIVVGAGTNGEFYGSPQSRVFAPVAVDPVIVTPPPLPEVGPIVSGPVPDPTIGIPPQTGDTPISPGPVPDLTVITPLPQAEGDTPISPGLVPDPTGITPLPLPQAEGDTPISSGLVPDPTVVTPLPQAEGDTPVDRPTPSQEGQTTQLQVDNQSSSCVAPSDIAAAADVSRGSDRSSRVTSSPSTTAGSRPCNAISGSSPATSGTTADDDEILKLLDGGVR